MGKKLGITFLVVLLVGAAIITGTWLVVGGNDQPAQTPPSSTPATQATSLTTADASATHTLAPNEVNGDHVDDFLPGPSTTP